MVQKSENMGAYQKTSPQSDNNVNLSIKNLDESMSEFINNSESGIKDFLDISLGIMNGEVLMEQMVFRESPPY